jgi:cation:H+ antiporter
LIALTLLELFGGLVYLLFGADLIVRGAVALARRANVPPAVVALTLVALGTSLPELEVTVQAAFSGHPGIALGNVVGSNIANVLLVGGGAAAIYPLAYAGGSIRRDSLLMILATLFFVALCLMDSLGRGAGILLLVGMAAVLIPSAREAARSHRDAEGDPPLVAVLGLPTHRRMILLFLVAGVVGLPLGAKLVVDSAVDIALRLGMTETAVGLTIIAFGTSLPEVATTAWAAFRRETEVAMGTIVGSNLFNVLGIMGVAALVSPFPITVPGIFPVLDLPVMLGASLVLALFAWFRRPLGRIAGVLLSVSYVAYIVVLLSWR